MQKAWIGFANWVSQHTAIVLGIAAALTIFLATGLTQLDFATGQDSYLNPDQEIAIDNKEYQDLFGGQAMLTVFTADEDSTVVDMFTPDNVAQWRAAADEIREIDGVQSVVSPLTALEWTQNLITPIGPDGELKTEDGNPVYASPTEVATSAAGQILLAAVDRETELGNTEAAAARSADSLLTVERLAAALEGGASFENPEWVEFLLVDNQGNIRQALRSVFQFAPGTEPTIDNAEFAAMVVRLDGNQSIDDEGAASDGVVAALADVEWENATALTTGAPVLLKDLNDYLKGGMLTLGGIAVLVMLVVLFVVFRVRWRLLSLGVVLVGVIWVFGLLGLIGFDLSLVTIAGLPILIGMGIDFSIQIQNRFEEEVVPQGSRAFSETVRNMGPPLVIAAIAAVAAFTAMQWSAVPMVRDFGILLSIGIAVLLVAGLTLPIALLGYRERRKPTTEEADHAAMEKSVIWLGSLPQWTVIPLMLLGVALFGFGILAEDAFEIETDPEKWVNQDSQVIADLNAVQSKTGSSSELGVFVKMEEGEPLFTDEVGEFMTDFAVGTLDDEPEALLTASSVATTLTYLMNVEGGTPNLAPTGDDLELGYAVAPDDIKTSVIALDNEGVAEAANLIFRTGQSSLDVRADVVAGMEESVEPDGQYPPPETVATATPSGLAVVGVGLLNNIEKNRTELTYIALVLAVVWLLVRLRSLGKTLLTLVPVLLAVGTSSLVVAAAGFKLSPLTTISGPLVIATCAEFSVLILTRYLEERRRGLAAREATDVASARTGRAFVASAFTTVGGFGVLIFSALPLLRDFGIIVTLNVAVALLSALVVVPPMLVWADERRLFNIWGAPRGIGPLPDEAETTADEATTADETA